MKLSLAQAHKLARQALRKLGFDAAESRIIGDHIVDAAARGEPFGGLARILVIGERIRRHGNHRPKLKITRKTPISLALDGRGALGYLVAHEATRRLIAMARQRGIGVVGVADIYYAGNLAYYIEQATRRGLITLAAANTRASMAPFGGADAVLGTNPVGFGFPTSGDPVILDISTSATSLGEVILAGELGELLPEGVALDRNGRPTRDPAAAMAGVFQSWGGHRGSGLAVAAQILGILAGSAPVIDDFRGWGYFALAFKPELLMPAARFKKQADALVRRIRGSRPVSGGPPPRVPFAGSIRARNAARRHGIEVPDKVYDGLLALAEIKNTTRR